MFKIKLIASTAYLAAALPLSAFAATDTVNVLLSMDGVVEGSVSTGDFDVVVQSPGTLKGDTQGSFTTKTPAILEVAHDTAPGANPFTDVSLTLDSTITNVNGVYDPSATVTFAADDVDLVLGTPHSLLTGGNHTALTTLITAEGTSAAVNLGETITTTANFTFLVTY